MDISINNTTKSQLDCLINDREKESMFINLKEVVYFQAPPGYSSQKLTTRHTIDETKLWVICRNSFSSLAIPISTTP
jgi:hypothetical protein